jgi:Fe-S cluster assembly protein SufD
MITPETTPLGNYIIGLFNERKADTGNALADIRTEALDTFKNIGFPTLKNEDWKYTNVAPLLKQDWQEAKNTSAITDIEKYLIPELDGHVLVFINGIYHAELSTILPEAEGVIVNDLATTLLHNEALVAAHFSKYADLHFNGFSASNTALAQQGAFIYVPEKVVMKHAVQLLFLGEDSNKVLNQLRNLIIIGEASQCSIIENYQSADEDAQIFSNIVTEISAGKNAVVDHYKFQLENRKSNQVNLTQINQAAGSLCNNVTITTGGALVRNDLNYKLDGKNCESHLYGLYISDETQHIDNHTFVDHAQPNCFSNEFYKGIMSDNSHAVFNGKIIVRPDAQKTNAYQSNRNVLLSDEAHINTKPQLEIFADDVKCSHGATTGQLNEEAIFYLRSRGIGVAEAKAMLTYAFADEVLNNIKIPTLNDFVKNFIRHKLGGEVENVTAPLLA